MDSKLSLHDRAVLNCVFNPSLPLTEAYSEKLTEELKDEEDRTDELMQIQKEEIRAISKAEEKDYVGALKILNDCLQILPQKASLYNNRAQIYQYLEKLEDAFNDLTKAIELSGDRQKRTQCQALCQRGLLHRKYNRLEFARKDFERAAKMGSDFAKSQLVEINPYAAMCNQMLRQVMDELQ